MSMQQVRLMNPYDKLLLLGYEPPMTPAQAQAETESQLRKMQRFLDGRSG